MAIEHDALYLYVQFYMTSFFFVYVQQYKFMYYHMLSALLLCPFLRRNICHRQRLISMCVARVKIICDKLRRRCGRKKVRYYKER